MTGVLRGFGFVFEGGAIRNWYVNEDGVKRWADTDELVEPTTDPHHTTERRAQES